MSRLKVQLVRVSDVLGIYGATKDEFPARMALLQPDAAMGFVALQVAIGTKVRVSDMFRTAEQSLIARSQKKGVQPPGFSMHGFGMAIDIAVDDLLVGLKVDKPGLDALMQQQGWFCHRKDGRRGSEDWHYNYLGNLEEGKALVNKWCKMSSNTTAAAEARLREKFGEGLVLEPVEVQECLKALRLYSGELDGKIGPRTVEAIKCFQRTWKIEETGTVDQKTERTLAYVAAEITIAEPPSLV